MAKQRADRLDPSILDRLLDVDATGTQERPGYSVRQMMDAVRTDLHHLLNTRRTLGEEAARFERVRRVLGYGMPDLISLNVITTEQQQEIAHLIEKTIRDYEPRLQDVRVFVLERQDSDPLKVRIHLTARLAVDPAPDVAIDATLELSTGHFVAEGRA